MMNKFLNVVLRESILDSPFASKNKFDPLGAGDVLGGVLGFFGSAMNAISQQDANMTNLKIARMNRDLQKETNAQNYKMFQEQNAWNLDQWNRQNAYNLPVHQVARLQNAGLNPSSFFGQATPAGQVQSQQAPSFVAPQMNYQQQPIDYSGIGNSVGQAINAYYDNQLKNEEAKKVAADGQISAANADVQRQRNSIELIKLLHEIDKLTSDRKLSDEQREYYESLKDQIKQQIELQKAQWNDLVVSAKKNNALTDANTDNAIASAAAKRAEAHLTNIIAEFQSDLMQSQINLNDSNAQAAIQSVANMVADGQLTTQRAISQELQNRLDIDRVKKEVIKNKMRNGKRFIRRTLNAIELVSESLASGVRGIIKW